jgi:hypothetical protein
MRSILLASFLASCALAQPPSLIRVIRQGSIQPYVSGQAQVNVLATSVIAGPAENWLIELHDSFASLENVDQALVAGGSLQTQNAPPFADDLLAQSRTLIATYRPGLSYRPDEGMQMFPRMRYLDFSVIRIRPGNEGDLGKLLKLRSISLDSINVDRPEIVYQVVAGAPAGTYVVIAPMISLRGLDNGRAQTPVYAEAAEDAAKKIAAGTELVREHLWLRIEPRLSYVSDEFASQDTAFWRPPK